MQRSIGNRATSVAVQRASAGACCGKCAGGASCQEQSEPTATRGGLVMEALGDEEIGYGVGGVQRLSAAERAVDLQSAGFSGNQRLERAFDNAPPLRQGESGEAVRLVQQAFLDLGLALPISTQNGTAPPDGSFGPETAQVARRFQQLNGLGADARLGRQTLTALEQEQSGVTAPGATPSSAAVTIDAVVQQPESFGDCGRFDLAIGWSTTGRNGFIVQEIVNSYDVRDCNDLPTGQFPATPHYWEAWRVGQDGAVAPRNGAINDIFHRVTLQNRRGTWHMTGNVFWVDHLDNPAAGFTFGGVRDAGVLLATTTAPSNLGAPALVRDVGGEWDCCDPDPLNHFHVPE